jgi:hypothetical protein
VYFLFEKGEIGRVEKSFLKILKITCEKSEDAFLFIRKNYENILIGKLLDL